jgi:RNA polymerase sigma factor for flagellar operon FliA
VKEPESRERERSNELVRQHLGLVAKAVSRVSIRFPSHVDREELWNAGALGLVEAAQRYDAETGIPFERYAAIRVRGAIIDSTRTRDWATRSVRRRARELDQAASELRQAQGRSPARSELAEALGVSEDELDRIQARAATSMLLSLDHQVDEGPPLRDQVVDENPDSRPDAALEQREMLGTLKVAVAKLTGVHRDVVQRYYLDGDLLQSIAADLGVTEARVSQIRSEALNSLRAFFATLYEGAARVDDAAPGKRARAAYLAEVSADSSWRTRLDAADIGAEQTAVQA